MGGLAESQIEEGSRFPTSFFKRTIQLPRLYRAARNGPVMFLISEVSSSRRPIPLVILVAVCSIAFSGPNVLPVPFGPIFVKFTLAFPLLSFGAVFPPVVFDCAMRFLTGVVSCCHSLLIFPCRAPLLKPQFEYLPFCRPHWSSNLTSYLLGGSARI